MAKRMSGKPFQLDLDKTIKAKAPKIYNKIPRFAINWLKRKIHLNELNDILDRYSDKKGVDFAEACVGYFNLNLKVIGLEKIPDKGRFIFASNHPLGGLDGICLSAVIGKKYNKNIRFPVNDILLMIENLQNIFVPINKHGNQSRKAASLMDEAYESDNQIITFPAGLCSRKQNGEIKDVDWRKNFVQKAIESKRDIVPVHFSAKNSNFFYRFANIRKRLGLKFNIEMLYLPDEMFKNKGQTFVITFGEPIPHTFFDKSKSAVQWAAYVKEKAYNLEKITR